MANFESYARVKPAFRSFNPASGDADSYSQELSSIANDSWHLYNNFAIAQGIVAKTVTTVVGAGLKFTPIIDRNVLGMSKKEAEAWQKDVRVRFDTWASSKEADHYRLANFYQLQVEALTTMMVDGDALGILTTAKRYGVPEALTVKLIEGRQLDSNKTEGFSEKIVGGVEYGVSGVTAYHILNRHPNSLYGNTSFTSTRIKAYSGIRKNIAHLMQKKRAGQRRGLSILAPVIEELLQLKRMTEAELTSVITTSMMVAFIKTDRSFEDIDGDGAADSNYDSDNNEYKLGNGTIIRLDVGESIDVLDPKRRNDTFVPFYNKMVETVAAATQIPPEVIFGKFDSSYSASRGALLEFWKTVKVARANIASDFSGVVYETWLLEEIVRDRIQAEGFLTDYAKRKAYCGGIWVGEGQGLLNPVNEVSAAVNAIDNQLSTRTQETRKLNGGDFDKNMDQLEEEKTMLESVYGVDDEI